MNNYLASWMADAMQTPTTDDLKSKLEFAAIGLKYGANPCFYKDLINIYMHELDWRNSYSTHSRSYCWRYHI